MVAQEWGGMESTTEVERTRRRLAVGEKQGRLWGLLP